MNRAHRRAEFRRSGQDWRIDRISSVPPKPTHPKPVQSFTSRDLGEGEHWSSPANALMAITLSVFWLAAIFGIIKACGG
jgi:hypothetical protein